MLGVLEKEPEGVSGLGLDPAGKAAECLAEIAGCPRFHSLSGSRSSDKPSACSLRASSASCASLSSDPLKASVQRLSERISRRSQEPIDSCSLSGSLEASLNASSSCLAATATSPQDRFYTTC